MCHWSLWLDSSPGGGIRSKQTGGANGTFGVSMPGGCPMWLANPQDAVGNELGLFAWSQDSMLGV